MSLYFTFSYHAKQYENIKECLSARLNRNAHHLRQCTVPFVKFNSGPSSCTIYIRQIAFKFVWMCIRPSNNSQDLYT